MHMLCAGMQVEKVDRGLVRSLSLTSRGSLPPLVAAIGGFAAQEAITALTGKFSPLQQWVSGTACSWPLAHCHSSVCCEASFYMKMYVVVGMSPVIIYSLLGVMAQRPETIPVPICQSC